MNNDERKLWSECIEDYKSSGLTVSKWCEDKDIPVHKLRYQINKFNKEKKKASKEINWASVVPAKSIGNKEATTPLKVIIGHSTIEVAPGFDSDNFQTVVRILSEQC